MDKYDEAVAYLTANPDKIYGAWIGPNRNPGGRLFYYVMPNVQGTPWRNDGKACGCLSMICGNDYHAWTDELTEEIRGDDRIPKTGSDVRVEHLPVFAEWQRRLDLELRNPPQLIEMKPDRKREAVLL